MRAAAAPASSPPVGACTTSTPPTPGAAAADSASVAKRAESSGSTWTMSDANRSPSRSAASAAMRPAAIALVTMLSVSLRTGRTRASISAATRRSSRLVTHNTPARRSAASKARSAAPLGSASRPPGRIATTGRSRDAARAAERKARRSRNSLISSRIAPVPGSRDSQSSTSPKPMSERRPMPTMWLKPTPLGCAQSSTVRHSEADCDTTPIRPAGGGRCAREAFNPMPGTAMPKDSGPSTRTPPRRDGSERSSASHRTTQANVPLAASARRSSGDGGVAMTARSAAERSAAISSVVSAAATSPAKPLARRFAITWPPRFEAAPITTIESGRNRRAALKRPAGLSRNGFMATEHRTCVAPSPPPRRSGECRSETLAAH